MHRYKIYASRNQNTAASIKFTFRQV
jgi:hypothetical protein